MLENHGDSNPTINAADDPIKPNSSQADTDTRSISDTTDSSDINSLLAYAFNIMGYHPEAKDAIASAMMVPNQS